MLVAGFASVGWRPIVDWVRYGPPEASGLGFEVRLPRWEFLRTSESDFLIPEQACGSCVRGAHDRCASKTGRFEVEYEGDRPGGPLVDRTSSVIFSGATIVSPPAASTRHEVTEILFPTTGRTITPADFTCPCCE